MLYGNESFDNMKEIYDKVDTSVDLLQIFTELAEFYRVELEYISREIIFPNKNDKYYWSMRCIVATLNKLESDLNDIQHNL